MCLNIPVRALGEFIGWFAAASSLVVGCGDSGGLSGSNGAVGPVADSGANVGVDSGAPPQAIDSGTSGDAAVDAGTPRADIPGVACSDPIADVYVTPASLPPLTSAARGDVVRCAMDSTLSVSDVQTAVTGAGDTGVTADSGVSIYRVAFRTTRGNGDAGISSARVYLPSAPLALPLPVITIGHATTGMGGANVPSQDPSSLKDLALPWAARGYAVIAPDYAGLGTAGVQGYVDNHDTGFSMLDGARALRKFLSPGAFSSKVLMAGHSQGGGGVLSAQALAKTYGCDGDLIGAIVFAPEWASRLDSFGYVGEINAQPSDLTISTGITNNVVAAYREYAYFNNYVGAAHATDAFPAAQASTEASMLLSLAQVPFGGYLQGIDPHIVDQFDPTFRASLSACMSGASTGCDARESAYLSFLQQNILTADPTGAKVLFVQGLLDEVMTAPQEGACNVQKLKSDGLTPQLCVDYQATHTNVTPRNIDFAIGWAQALLGGTTLPTCSSFGMPTCVP